MPANIANKDWEKHWVDMPEFEQPAQKPFATINFRFDTEKDLDDFCKLIGQNLTQKTKAARFPKVEASPVSGKSYVDEV